MKRESTRLAFALRYARHGWAVLPLYERGGEYRR